MNNQQVKDQLRAAHEPFERDYRPRPLPLTIEAERRSQPALADHLRPIRRAASGGMAFGVRPGQGVLLSDRERQAVQLIVDGASNDEIGGRLGISARTVESHLRRLFDRTEVASHTELASRALREGWLEELG